MRDCICLEQSFLYVYIGNIISLGSLSQSQQMTAEGFLRQLEEASCIQALVLVEDSNHPGICWKGQCNRAQVIQEISEMN